MAAWEGAPPMPPEEMLSTDYARRIVEELHAYEAKRGGHRAPNPGPWWHGNRIAVLAAYERARSLP